MQFDLSMPAQLTSALGPDLLLMGGAMLLLLWSGWRRESDAHQRSVGILGIALCILTMAAVGYYAYRGYTASVGVIAVDNFRWASDEIFLRLWDASSTAVSRRTQGSVFNRPATWPSIWN